MPNDITYGNVEDVVPMTNRPYDQSLNAAQRQRTPISLLPEEVLLIVFLLVRDTDSRDPKVVLNTITHVCRDWRWIATHAPLLWTRLSSTSHPDWTTAALQRSKSAPISVKLGLRLVNSLCDLSKKLLGHISHTSTLEIQGPVECLDEAQELISECDASHLEELVLWCSSHGLFPLSSTTFRNTHRLRILWLIEVHIDFRSPLLRNLTSLWISYPKSNEAVLPSWLQIFQALAAMPHLEELSLFNIFPPLDAVQRPEEVHLQSLKKLSLEFNAASGVHAFLAVVFFPPLSNFHVRWHTSDLGEDQITIFETIAESAHSDTLGSNISSLTLQQFTPFGAGVTTLNFESGSTFKGPSLKVTMPYDSLEIRGVNLVTDFIEIMGATNIIAFQAPSVDYDFFDEDILRLIEKMPLLLVITVAKATAWSFIEVIGMDPITPRSESAPPIYLPKLGVITLFRCDFAESETWINEVAMPVFAKRQDHGAGVQILYLEDCENLSLEMLRTLEKGVPKVEVPEDFFPQPGQGLSS